MKKINKGLLYSALTSFVIAGAAGTTFTVLSTTTAEAGCCYTFGQGSRQHSQTRDVITQHFTQELNAAAALIANELRLQSGQLSGNLKEQTAASSNIAQAQDNRARQREIERVKVDAQKTYTTSPGACVVISTAKNAGNFSRSEPISYWTRMEMDQIAAFDMGAPVGSSGAPVSAQGDLAAESALVRMIAGSFCSPADVQAGLCTTPVAPELQSAPIIASKSIFSSDQYDDDLIKDSCSMFVMTSGGRTMGPIDANLAGTSSAGSQILADRNSTRATHSVAEAVMMEYCSKRHPITNPEFKIQIEDIAKKVSSYQGVSFEKGVSWSRAFDIKSRQWIDNTEYLAELQKYGADQIAREQVHINAFMAMQNAEIYKLLDKMSVVQATQLQVLTDMLQLQRESSEVN